MDFNYSLILIIFGWITAKLAFNADETFYTHPRPWNYYTAI